MNHAPILVIVIPLLAAFLTHLTKYTKLRRAAEIVAAGSLALSLFFLLSMAGSIFAGNTITYNLGGWPAPIGISLAVDSLSFFFSFLVLGVGLIIIIYSLGIYLYARRYYSLLLIALSGILGIVLTRDIFNLYVYFEILAVSSYVLITYKRKPRAIRASLKYLIITESVWVLFLFAIALLYALTGTLNMDGIALQIEGIFQSNPYIIYLIFSMMLIAFGVKCGMFPLHTWVPEVHSQAPTPVSSLLSGLILKTGIYAMLRVFFLFFGPALFSQGPGNIIFSLGIVTLVFGAGMALVQDELKRLLAYSSISQIGFILVGVGLGTQFGLKGGLFHVFNHAIIKAALFFCAGIIISQTGFWRISNMKGIWKQMPGVTFAFCLLSLSEIGIPPFNGFISKMLIIEAALIEKNYLITFFLFIGIILTAAYYFRVIQTFFSPEEFQQKRDFIPIAAGPFEHFSTYIFVFICLLIGIFPALVMNIIQPAVRVLLP